MPQETQLKKTNVNLAVDAINAYVTTTTPYFQEIKTLVERLREGAFVGDASNGMFSFFQNTVTPLLTVNLTDGNGSLMAGLKTMINGAYDSMNAHVDVKLGDGNKSAGN